MEHFVSFLCCIDTFLYCNLKNEYNDSIIEKQNIFIDKMIYIIYIYSSCFNILIVINGYYETIFHKNLDKNLQLM